MNATEYTTIVSRGPDWVTLTAEGEVQGTALMSSFNLLAKEQESRDFKKTPWRFQGYRGFQIEGAKCAVRGTDEAILVLTGEASQAWYALIKALDARCTRFDIQTTVEVQPPKPSLARHVYLSLEKLNNGNGRERYIKYISSPTGDTVYVGKRKNTVLLRLYDKSLYFGEEPLGTYWRYEVEFKGTAAQAALDKFKKANDAGEWIGTQVFQEFSSRNVKPVFSVRTSVLNVETAARITTLEGQIKWLERCVSPVVVQLVNDGHVEMVLDVLKLKHLVAKGKG